MSPDSLVSGSVQTLCNGEGVSGLSRCKMTNRNQQQLQQHCCFPSSFPFWADGRSRKSRQLLLIKTTMMMMMEWGMLRRSSRSCTNRKHASSILRQDIIPLCSQPLTPLPTKNLFSFFFSILLETRGLTLQLLRVARNARVFLCH